MSGSTAGQASRFLSILSGPRPTPGLFEYSDGIDSKGQAQVSFFGPNQQLWLVSNSWSLGDTVSMIYR